MLLSKLSTPCLDFLLLHCINAHTLRILPQAEKLAEQKEEKCDLEKKHNLRADQSITWGFKIDFKGSCN